jgi:hypothetical protein
MGQSNGKEQSFEIDARNEVARLDMAFGLASIVRPARSGLEKKAIEKKQPWKGGEVTFKGIELDDNEFGVLLALLVIAEKNPILKKGRESQGLLPVTRKTNLASDADVVTINTTYAEIRRILDLKSDGRNNNDAIFSSITTLATIVVEASFDDDRAFTHLIGNGTGEENKSLSLTLSYRLTRALLGEGSYAAIEMRTFRKLRGTSRVLYAYMCAWCIECNCQKQTSIIRLVERVYGRSSNELSASSMKNYRRAIRNGFKQIEQISDKFNFRVVGEIVAVQKITPRTGLHRQPYLATPTKLRKSYCSEI